jgi:DNA-binding MltR family transcriptional regulator
MAKTSHKASRVIKRSEEEVAKVAGQIRGVVLKALIEQLNDVDLKTKEFERFFRGLMDASDTVMAIVSYSYIDDRLRDLFSQAVNPEIRGGSESLFEINGPLAASSARIQMAAALYWLERKTYLNLHSIRKIRNEFAHKPFARNFGDKRIAGLVSAMVPMEHVALKVVNLDEEAPLTDKQRFFLRTMLTCQGMIIEMVTAPQALRMGLSPSSTSEVDWDELPESIKELYRVVGVLAHEYLVQTPVQ